MGRAGGGVAGGGREPALRQGRRCHVRRHQRDRHDRAHRDQYSRRRVQPGLWHAVFVLAFMLTPRASFIPLSALAGVLVVVCWNMAEKEAFLRLLHDWRSAAMLIATFGLTVIEDLTFGIVAGYALAAALAIYDRIRA